MPNGTITVPVRVRGLWRVRLLLGALYVARWAGIIESNEHAVAIAARLIPNMVRVEVAVRGKWR